ncbi:hypothetical protein ATN83_1453 [Raoultella ornithinolytica]|nr:hypothetical protein ATN83_1453 [Raoultella ornithinolytica]
MKLDICVFYSKTKGEVKKNTSNIPNKLSVRILANVLN